MPETEGIYSLNKICQFCIQRTDTLSVREQGRRVHDVGTGGETASISSL